MAIGKRIRLFTVVMALCAAFSATANAVFSKTAEFTDGRFEDVTAADWFFSDVIGTYEYGLMNGISDSLFSPMTSMTVAEGITLTARVHAQYHNERIPQYDGEHWYDSYVMYAKENGVVSDEQFDDYDRSIRRHEVVSLIAAALPRSFFPPVNAVTDIPDVYEGENYYETLMTMYNAGVVMGSDAYGSFHPDDDIKRCEVAAIINRTVFPESRLKKALAPSPENDAFLLIDDEIMQYVTVGKKHLASSWNYENSADSVINLFGATTSELLDDSSTGHAAINRTFRAQDHGIMTVEAKLYVGSEKNGVRMYFDNTIGLTVWELETKDGFYTVITPDGTTRTTIPAKNGNVFVKAVFNLDSANGSVYVNNEKAADFSLGAFGNMTKLTFATTDAEKPYLIPKTVRISMNYNVLENFESGFVPYDWDAEGAENVDYSGRNLYFAGTGHAEKHFAAVDGKAVFETYVYAPEKADSVTVSLGQGTENALAAVFHDGALTVGGLSVQTQNNQWQILHIEINTDAGNAALYLNGRIRGTFDISAAPFDTVRIDVTANSGDGGVYVDDIKVQKICDYADYCPAPQKVTSDDYLLVMSVCSLWHEGTHSGWDFVSPFAECSPLLGYYDEGTPEAMDWEIKQMAEHGISAMQFCWFSDGSSAAAFDKPQKNNALRQALTDGYFYAKYKQDVDYCILWENAQYIGTTMTFDQFKRFLWDYWVEYFFTDPSYLTVDNKIFFEIYDYGKFKSTFGGVEGCKAVIDFMREDITQYGFDGIIVLFGTNIGGDYEGMAEMGGDGVAPYAYAETSYDPEVLKASYDRNVDEMAAYDGLSFVPTVATGRNGLGWAGKRSPLSSVAQFEKTLSYAKDALARQSGKSEPWRSRVVYFSTWNEYAEGHWLAPSGLNGYGYADAWRKAFTAAPEVHTDILPTAVQKKRIGRLYNLSRTPVRSLQTVQIEDGEIPAALVERYEFFDESEKEQFTFNQQFASAEFDLENGMLSCTTKAKDCIIWTKDNLNFPAKDVAMVHFQIRTSQPETGNLFFTTTDSTSWTASKSYSFSTPANEFTDIYIFTESNERWQGTIKQLRFDFVEGICSFDVDYIEYLTYSDDQVGKTVTVDGTELTQLRRMYVRDENDETYVIGSPDTGIYSALNLYYEWNRFTGKLFLKAQNGTSFEFTAGKSICLVNGKEETLAKPFSLYDGMPMLPLTFILGKADMAYTETDKTLDVMIGRPDYADVIAARQRNIWTFDVQSDSEKWTAHNGDAVIWDGKLEFMPAYIASAGTGYDGFIRREGLSLDAAGYTGVRIRMKYEYLGNAHGKKQDNNLTIYFATNNSTGLNEDQTLRTKLTDGVDDGDGYKVYTFDATANERWTDTITLLRFDLGNNNCICTIDCIELIPGENTAALTSVYSHKRTLVYEVTFDNESDKDLFNYVFASGAVVSDGMLTLTAKSPDPQITFGIVPNALKKTNNYDLVVVRMKIDSEKTAYSTFFFMTEGMTGYKADRNSEVNVSKLEKDEDGFYTVEYDLSKNAYWKGVVTGLRIDPAEIECAYTIDSIAFYKK